MDRPKLEGIAEKHRHREPGPNETKKKLADLYAMYFQRHQNVIVDTVAACAAIDLIFNDSGFDTSRITPQIQEAFDLQYPNMELEDIPTMNDDKIAGIVQGWKGKYFEVLMRDKLNSGETIGDISLGLGQHAELAGKSNQVGWDIQIVNSDGSVDNYLNTKATDSLGYIHEAIVKYPDVKIISTDGFDSTHGEFIQSELQNIELKDQIHQAAEYVINSPLQNVLEEFAPFMPFLIIAAQESFKGKREKSSNKDVFLNIKDRSVKTGTAMIAGFIVHTLNGGLLSIPATAITRLYFDRYKFFNRVNNSLNNDIEVFKRILA